MATLDAPPADVAAAPRPRRLWRRVARGLVGTVAALLILPWLWIRLFQPAPGPVRLPPIASDQGTRVYVMAYDRHASFVIEQQPGWQLGPPGQEAAPFVEIGWGNRDWYMGGNRRWWNAVYAAFLPSASVVYTAGYPAPPHEHFLAGDVYVREFQGEELASLLKTLEESITRTSDGGRADPFPTVAAYPGRFYPSREYYIFWHSCNHWVVEELRKSGQPVSERFVFTAPQALGRLEGWQRLR